MKGTLDGELQGGSLVLGAGRWASPRHLLGPAWPDHRQEGVNHVSDGNSN